MPQHSAAASSTWTPPANVLVDSEHDPNYPLGTARYTQPSLAVDPTRPRHLAVGYVEGNYRDTCYLGLSNDGGQSWHTVPVVGTVTGSLFSLASVGPGYPSCPAGSGGPVVAFGPDGTLYYAFIPRPTATTKFLPKPRTYITVSADGGRTFSQPHLVYTAEPASATANHGEVTLAIDQSSGRVYVAWVDTQTYSIYMSTSTDRGVTFSATPTLVNPDSLSQDGSVPVSSSPALAIDGSGRVYLVWFDGWRIDIACSDDLGQTLGPPATCVPALPPAGTRVPPSPIASILEGPDITGLNGNLQYFSLLAGTAAGQSCSRSDRSGCRLDLTWFGADGLRDRIWFASSTDGGASWCASAGVGCLAGHAGREVGIVNPNHDQSLPSLSLAPNGDLYLGYYDVCAAGQPGQCDDSVPPPPKATIISTAWPVPSNPCYDAFAAPASATCYRNAYLLVSHDGGLSFSSPDGSGDAPLRVSAVASNTRSYDDSGYLGLGSYLDQPSGRSGYYLAWTDTRRTCPAGSSNADPCNYPGADVFFASPRLRPGCSPTPDPIGGELAVSAGYSMLAVPDGNVISWSRTTLYSWFDQGAGASYSSQPSDQPAAGGHGYWAWFACPSLVPVRDAGSGPLSFPLHAYHASMLGNPLGTGPAVVSGQDFAAQWDSTMHGGRGGYHYSSYRQAVVLDVGAAIWAFSYVDTTVTIAPAPPPPAAP